MAVHTAHNPQEFLWWVANSIDGDTIQVSTRDMIDYKFNDLTGPIQITKYLTILPESPGLLPWPNFVFSFSSKIPCFEYVSSVTGGRLQQIILSPTYPFNPVYLDPATLGFKRDAPTKTSPSNLIIDRVYVDGSRAGGGYAAMKGMGGSLQGNNTFTGIKIHHLRGMGMHFVSDGFGNGSTISDVEIYELRNSGYGNHGMDVTAAKNCTFRNINPKLCVNL